VTAILKRTTLKVRDMNQSIAFYQGVLGMTKYYDDEITLSGDLLPGGADEDSIIRLAGREGLCS